MMKILPAIVVAVTAAMGAGGAANLPINKPNADGAVVVSAQQNVDDAKITRVENNIGAGTVSQRHLPGAGTENNASVLYTMDSVKNDRSAVNTLNQNASGATVQSTDGTQNRILSGATGGSNANNTTNSYSMNNSQNGQLPPANGINGNANQYTANNMNNRQLPNGATGYAGNSANLNTTNNTQNRQHSAINGVNGNTGGNTNQSADNMLSRQLPNGTTGYAGNSANLNTTGNTQSGNLAGMTSDNGNMGGGTVRFLDDTQTGQSGVSAQIRYQMLKEKLDQTYEHMFNLKEELDRTQSAQQSKWDEYHLLHRQYERGLKRIIADWVSSESLNA